jgi:hypothetical protein
MTTKTLLARNFGEVSFKFRRWSAELTPDQTLEDALVPNFWKGQAEIVRGHSPTAPKGRGDIIEIRKPDTGLYAELIVVEIGPDFIRTQPIKAYIPDDVQDPDGVLVTKWNFGKKMHEVVRKSDGTVIKSDFQTKQAAVDWIAESTVH